MREDLRATASRFAAASLVVLPLLLVVRAYEMAAVRVEHGLPPGMGRVLLGALRSDVAVACVLALALALPVLLLSRWSARAAAMAHRVVVLLVIVAAVLLAQYFATTLVPLGSDLFGYSWAEIRDTVRASKGESWAGLLAVALLAAASWVASGLAWRRGLPGRATLPALALLAIGAIASPLLAISPSSFGSDAAYFLAESKPRYLLGAAVGRVRRASASGPPLAGYPLLRRDTHEDVLGPRLRQASSPPNIVIVVVEGLGRDFVGPGARWGGFTPFLDSLATRSLYWENALSTTGRTFGVLPGLLASLPQGEEGVMALGARAPRHRSLVTLLGAQGYRTSYFTGTDGHFDLIDTYLARQGIGRLVDQTDFGPRYTKEPGGSGGFSWGYADADLYARSLELLGADDGRPRLDVYLTISTHEPFIPPERERWRAEYERRLAAIAPDAERREAFVRYAAIFESLLYADDALRGFIAAYARRPDFARTIFVITGDHRLIPLPPDTRIARYHVPLILWSPLVAEPARFPAVVSHLDVAPSLLALLGSRYGLQLPDSVHWLGRGLDTARVFRNRGAIALMRAKGQLDEFLDGDHFLSMGELFRLGPGMRLEPMRDAALADSLARRLAQAGRVARWVVANDRILPPTGADVALSRAAAHDDSVFRAAGLRLDDLPGALAGARSLAERKDYERARAVVRRMLREAPEYHDARVLIGRSLGWERRFPEARAALDTLVRRAPEYADGYVARVQVELWDERADSALAFAREARRRFPRDPDVLLVWARALELSSRRPEALAALDTLRTIAPAFPGAAEVRARLAR